MDEGGKEGAREGHTFEFGYLQVTVEHSGDEGRVLEDLAGSADELEFLDHVEGGIQFENYAGEGHAEAGGGGGEGLEGEQAWREAEEEGGREGGRA